MAARSSRPRGILASRAVGCFRSMVSAGTRYLLVPPRPQGTDDFSEDRLASLATGNGMIGIALV